MHYTWSFKQRENENKTFYMAVKPCIGIIISTFLAKNPKWDINMNCVYSTSTSVSAKYVSMTVQLRIIWQTFVNKLWNPQKCSGKRVKQCRKMIIALVVLQWIDYLKLWLIYQQGNVLRVMTVKSRYRNYITLI